jgi:hypothetical protein
MEPPAALQRAAGFVLSGAQDCFDAGSTYLASCRQVAAVAMYDRLASGLFATFAFPSASSALRRYSSASEIDLLSSKSVDGIASIEG